MAVSRENELGGLWLKKSGSGTKFMSGKLTLDGKVVEVVVFKNQYKEEGDNKPDYRVYKSEPRNGGQQPQRRPASIADELDDEIPFAWLGVLVAPALALLTMGGLA